jgi:C4-dicarboxylate transporter DctM subunit
MSVTAVLFSSFAGLLLIGAPITVALGVSALLSFMVVGQDLTTLIQIAFTSVNSFPIMALPAFVLAGALMDKAGVSKRLVTVAEKMVGPIPGGLAVSTALACVFFGAISGSGPATTAAVGMLMIPAMTKRGFSKGYAAAATATAGGVGIIIPPSIPMVIYGVTSQESITEMFLAGVVPGLMISLGLCAMHLWRCRKMDVGEDMQAWSASELLKALKEGFWAILAPVVILGGIYGGFFTPTEAAVVAIFYVLFIGFFVYKELTFGCLMKCLETTSWITGRVLIIMFTAYAFGRLLVQYRIPNQIVDWLLTVTTNVNLVWLFVIVILLFFGMFMETLAIILLVTPVLLPVMTAFGVDPIHFGVVLVCCCGVGFSTPPLGENMFIASGIADESLERISLQALPFCAITIGVIVLITFFPQLVLFLPNLLM